MCKDLRRGRERASITFLDLDNIRVLSITHRPTVYSYFRVSFFFFFFSFFLIYIPSVTKLGNCTVLPRDHLAEILPRRRSFVLSWDQRWKSVARKGVLRRYLHVSSDKRLRKIFSIRILRRGIHNALRSDYPELRIYNPDLPGNSLIDKRLLWKTCYFVPFARPVLRFELEKARVSHFQRHNAK